MIAHPVNAGPASAGPVTATIERLDRRHPEAERFAEALRIAEALLFSAADPVATEEIAGYLPSGVEVGAVLAHLEATYAARGVNLVRLAGRFAFRTAPDIGHLLVRRVEEPRRLSRAALETLAIIAYHQPVTRGEIEEIRGVATSKGTLDALLEAGFVRLRGRRRTPGRPLTFGTTPDFLSHFGLDRIDDLPGLEELKSAGFIDGKLPKGMPQPQPDDSDSLRADEDPLDDLFAPLDAAEPSRQADPEA